MGWVVGAMTRYARDSVAASPALCGGGASWRGLRLSSVEDLSRAVRQTGVAATAVATLRARQRAAPCCAPQWWGAARQRGAVRGWGRDRRQPPWMGAGGRSLRPPLWSNAPSCSHAGRCAIPLRWSDASGAGAPVGPGECRPAQVPAGSGAGALDCWGRSSLRSGRR